FAGRPASAAPARPKPHAAAVRAPAASLVSLTVDPASLQLSGPEARRQLLVTGRFSDGSEQDLTRSVRYFAASPVCAVSPDGVVTPKADGTGMVALRSGTRTAKVPVTVISAREYPPARLVADVVPVLTKLGCNQGACHGAAAG